MPGLFDLNRPDLRRSLKDSILWCADRQLTATPADDEEIRRRRELMDRAQELLHGAIVESRSLLNRIRRRNYTELVNYQRGMELVSQANPVSFTSFTKRLRSAELHPSASLSGAENPGFIVQSVVSRRATLVIELSHLQTAAHRAEGRLLTYWPEENWPAAPPNMPRLDFLTWTMRHLGTLGSHSQARPCSVGYRVNSWIWRRKELRRTLKLVLRGTNELLP